MGAQVINWYAIILAAYNAGDYTADQIATYVILGKITIAQYQTITGLTWDGLAYFELHYSQQSGVPTQTEATTYAGIAKGFISNADYYQCIYDAYNTYSTITITVVASYVVSGHLTATQYQTITGQVYGA